MRRRNLRIRRLLVVGAAFVTLAFAASASAMPAGDGGGGRAVYTQPTAAPADSTGGANWWYVGIGSAVALGAALGAAGLVRSSGNRRRLEGLAH